PIVWVTLNPEIAPAIRPVEKLRLKPTDVEGFKDECAVGVVLFQLPAQRLLDLARQAGLRLGQEPFQFNEFRNPSEPGRAGQVGTSAGKVTCTATGASHLEVCLTTVRPNAQACLEVSPGRREGQVFISLVKLAPVPPGVDLRVNQPSSDANDDKHTSGG